MRKGFSKKEHRFIQEAREVWASLSAEYRERYAANHDPREVVAFLNADPRAIKEPWVAEELIRALQEGRRDFCHAIASALANRRTHSKHTTAVRSLVTMLEIDRLVTSGQCRTQAEAFTFFLKVMEDLQPGQGWTFDRVKNEYFRARRRKTRVHIEEQDGWTCVCVSPEVIEWDGRKLAGTWELRMCPGKQDEVSFSYPLFDLIIPRVSRTPAR